MNIQLIIINGKVKRRVSHTIDEKYAIHFLIKDVSVKDCDIRSINSEEFSFAYNKNYSIVTFYTDKNLDTIMSANFDYPDNFNDAHPGNAENIILKCSEDFKTKSVVTLITTVNPLLLNGLKKEQIHIIKYDGSYTLEHPEIDIIGLGAEGIYKEIFGLETTFDQETFQNNKIIHNLNRKKLLGTLTVNENMYLNSLNERCRFRGYDNSLSDPLYSKFLNGLKEKLRQETDENAVIDSLIEEVLENWNKI